jgi:hypothetical protein
MVGIHTMRRTSGRSTIRCTATGFTPPTARFSDTAELFDAGHEPVNQECDAGGGEEMVLKTTARMRFPEPSGEGDVNRARNRFGIDMGVERRSRPAKIARADPAHRRKQERR